MRVGFHVVVAASLLATALAQAPKPVLPRVLLIGDVSCNNHFQNLEKALKGKAEVVRSPLGHLATGAAWLRREELLQGQRWDVVCCNFGLSDLMYRDPRSSEVRAMSPKAGGVPVTKLGAYKANLAKLVVRFKKSTRRVVWLTTMPLQPRQRSGAIVAADVDRYNAAATPILRELGAEVVDTHAQIETGLAKAKNRRARDRQHHALFKTDLSAPLVKQLGVLLSSESPKKKPGNH